MALNERSQPPPRILAEMRTAILGILSCALFVVGCGSSPDESPERPSEAEYRAAAHAMISCIEERGYTASGPNLNERTGQLGVGVDVTDDDAGASAALEECHAEHVEEIEIAYLKPERLTGEARNHAMRELISCLEGHGVTGLSETATDSTVFVDAIMNRSGLSEDEAWEAMSCMDTYIGVWPPGDSNNP